VAAVDHDGGGPFLRRDVGGLLFASSWQAGDLQHRFRVSQFTGAAFTRRFSPTNGIAISMDGKRKLGGDNVFVERLWEEPVKNTRRVYLWRA